jgi:hypothetical protein
MKFGGFMGDPEITGEHEVDLGLERRRLGEPFLKGPILLRDLAPISKLPGKALALWLLIRYRSDVSGEAWHAPTTAAVGLGHSQ